ncbi:hypothetical protein Vafri_1304, partial [Volvox africanus]
CLYVLVTPPTPTSTDGHYTFAAEFCPGDIPTTRSSPHSDGSQTIYFSPDDILALLSALFSATFIRFGPHLVRQVCGIPMGISPAPYIANLFLGWCEYEFLRQFYSSTITPPAKHVLSAFRFTKRYLDDLLSLRNKHLASLLVHSLDFIHPLGLHGIYPPALDIPQQSHPEGTTPFLDILLIHSVRNGCSWYTTHLYDKLRQPAFQEIRLSRFVHASSCVNEAAKRNIFISQFRRLQRLIIDVDDFIPSVAQLMATLVAQGYPRRRLEFQCAQQLFFWPQLFLVQRRQGLDVLAAIRHSLATLLPSLT